MRTTFAILVLGALACNKPSNGSGSGGGRDAATLEQARAAIHALEKRDADAVAACDADVRRCLDARADGGDSGLCDELREQCDEAKHALDETRGPAVECWHKVEQCAQQGKPFPAGEAGASTRADAGSSCDVTPRDCEDAGEDADEDRDPVLECRDAVRECWHSLRSRSEAFWTECGEMRDTCHDICGLSAHRGRDRHGAKERVRGLLRRLHDRKHRGHGHDDGDADAGSR